MYDDATDLMLPMPEDDNPREPPHSLEAEQSLIGSLLQDNAAMAVVVDLVDANSFYVVAHRWIYEAVAQLLSRRVPADVVTVFEALVAADRDEACNGLPYLQALEHAVPSARNVRQYATIVAERFAERALGTACSSACR
jgi:replicative DNA helicase